MFYSGFCTFGLGNFANAILQYLKREIKALSTFMKNVINSGTQYLNCDEEFMIW